MNEKLDEYVSFSISEDEMIAKLYLTPPNSDLGEYKLEEIIEYLKSKGIVEGILVDVLSEMIEKKIYGKEFIIAKGRKQIDSKDGYFLFKFNTNPSKSPKILEDGSVDYYSLNLIENVKEGQELATYIPKTQGEDGITVTGKLLKASVCKDMPVLKGKGFEVSEDKLTYTASYDGKVELSVGHLNVAKAHLIKGDVNISTGNIEFYGDLEISGDVKTGMKVKATGNVMINGLVEAANIEAGKDILIKGGILGGNKASIIAGGDVIAKFIELANVQAGGIIRTSSLIHSHASAGEDVICLGKNASIIGGFVKANHYIKSDFIGNHLQTKTEVIVGIEDFTIINQKVIEADLEEAKEDLEKIEKTLTYLQEREDEKSKGLKIQLLRAKIDKIAYIQKFKTIYEEVEKRILIGKGAEIIAAQKVYSGTHIKIDSAKLPIKETYENIVFSRKGKWIVTKRYVEEDYKVFFEHINKKAR